MSNSNNNGANNNDNQFNGGFIMGRNTIKTKETFIETVKAAMELVYEDCKVMVNPVVKNNDLKLDGLTILAENTNITPTIYLNAYYEDYRAGRPMSDICKEITRIYEDHKVQETFDAEKVVDFDAIKSRICFKLVNKERNRVLLQDTPFIEYLDLAIVFFVLVSEEKDGNATITVKDRMLELWGIKDIKKLFTLAHKNTQRLFRGDIHTMLDILVDIISDSEGLDSDIVEEFFHMDIDESGRIPMYVATNRQKLNGAGVMLYTGCLKTFAERIGSDFYILPSSIHEVLFVPADSHMDERSLVEMVREVNMTQVAPNEILSDNVYRYYANTDHVEIVASI